MTTHRAPVRAIVLAAGQGTRMKSPLPKVLHQVCGKPMVERIVERAHEAGAAGAVLVVGYGREQVEGHMRKVAPPGFEVDFALQPEQRGTADAVRCALPVLERFDGWLLIVNGDVPNITATTLERLIELGTQHPDGMALVTAVLDDPSGYGRIVRSDDGLVARIVEDKDCTGAERAITEINAGLYLARAGFVREHLSRISASNAQREFYLTDLVELAGRHGSGARALVVDDPREVAGVNDRSQLAEAEAWAQQQGL